MCVCVYYIIIHRAVCDVMRAAAGAQLNMYDSTTIFTYFANRAATKPITLQTDAAVLYIVWPRSV